MMLLLFAILIAGCQSNSPEVSEVPVTVEVTRVVEVAAEAPDPETIEVTRLVEVVAEAPEPEIVEVTRVVEVPAEQPPPEAPAVNPMIPVEFDAISSSITGRDYSLKIILPASYMFTEASYPVVYVTDGDFYAIPLALAAGQLSFGQELPEFIVVGVDYGVPDPMAWLELRELDMGPDGRAAFLQFFTEELIPTIETTYRADGANRTLAGHSTGADFALYALLAGADAFNQFIASSPGAASDMTGMLATEGLGDADGSTRLFLSVGDLDDAALVTGVEAFDAALFDANVANLSHQTMILDGETHLSARPRAFNNGLRWIFAGETEATSAAESADRAAAAPQVLMLPGTDLELTLVNVPAGPFLMGSESDEADRDESPEHEVYLDAYWIGMTEVTNAQYAACEAAGVCAAPTTDETSTLGSIDALVPKNYYLDPEDADRPVIFVTWDDAVTFCGWAGLALPTEAQWEKAARGTDGRTYPWGEEIGCINANYGDCEEGFALVGAHAEYGSSPYGVLDMGGNVAEWVADWYASNYYMTSPDNNPTGPESGRSRVTRGGYFDPVVGYGYYSYANWTPEKFARVTDRVNGNPAVGSWAIGFRCVVNP
jgi:formylglycine-generating enzyme required for sulfatase activity